jgi:hypothetical protein
MPSVGLLRATDTLPPKRRRLFRFPTDNGGSVPESPRADDRWFNCIRRGDPEKKALTVRDKLRRQVSAICVPRLQLRIRYDSDTTFVNEANTASVGRNHRSQIAAN